MCADKAVDFVADPARVRGSWCTDGSIELPDDDLTPDVIPGDLIARAPSGALESGANVRVDLTAAGQEYYATAEGNARLVGNTISVVPLLVIDGDVGYDTGNLDFDGDIHISGRIGPGYSVKSGGSVLIRSSIGEGASVLAKGDVTACRGISGRKTKVIAVGGVRTAHVQEATVQCAGDLTVGNHVVDAHLRCGGVLTVDKGEGTLGGSIAGGQSWGLKGVEMFRAGSPSGASTALNVGLNPDQAGKLDELQKKLAEFNKVITRHLARFNLKEVDVPQIQKLLGAATGPQRKMLARSAKQLGELLQAHQKLLNERSEIEIKMILEFDQAAIVIAEMAYAGVQVRVGDHRRRLSEASDALQFFVDEEGLRERNEDDPDALEELQTDRPS